MILFLNHKIYVCASSFSWSSIPLYILFPHSWPVLSIAPVLWGAKPRCMYSRNQCTHHGLNSSIRRPECQLLRRPRSRVDECVDSVNCAVNSIRTSTTTFAESGSSWLLGKPCVWASMCLSDLHLIFQWDDVLIVLALVHRLNPSFEK